jgi:hypothetical protein
MNTHTHTHTHTRPLKATVSLRTHLKAFVSAAAALASAALRLLYTPGVALYTAEAAAVLVL